jgi:hypothetical protein
MGKLNWPGLMDSRARTPGDLSLEIKMNISARQPRLMPVIIATQEAEIRRIAVQSQPGQIVLQTLSQKPHHKKGWRNGSRCRPNTRTQKKNTLHMNETVASGHEGLT